MTELEFLAAVRSTRRFTDEPVAVADLARLVDTARWAGSARNRQPWRFVAVTDAETRGTLSRLGPYAGHLADAPAVIVVLSADNDRSDTEFDVGRVTQAMATAAHALGLGSCVVTFHPASAVAAVAETLRVAPGWLPYHGLALGHPAPRPRTAPSTIPTGRLPVADLLRHHHPA